VRYTMSADKPGQATPPRAWPPRGDRAESARAAPAGVGRLGHCAAGPGQQCWASGWKAGPVLCGDFLIFNFRLNILENSYKFQKCIENTILLRKIRSKIYT
jgi:hypothetical protein